MPSKKKTAREMTTKELAERIFPKEVRDKVKELVGGDDGEAKQRSSHKKRSTK